jgi:hypothetical protein
MNFLQLCQAVAEDSGTVAGVPNFTTVTGATGRVKQVVGWTRDAYIDIQNERNDWRWMRTSFEKALTIDQIAYDALTDWSLDNVSEWLPDLPAEGWRNLSIYESGFEERESDIAQIEYNLFRQRYQRGAHDANQPVEWSISPTNQLLFGPKPDKAYVVRGEYRTTPETLVADDDIPSMPAQYHRVIVQEAMRLMSRSDEAFQVLAVQAEQYVRLRSGLVNTQTGQVKFGGGTFA